MLVGVGQDEWRRKTVTAVFLYHTPPVCLFPNGDELMFFSSFCMDAGFESLDFLLSLLGDV